jgi:hypothetical protein
MVTMYLPTIDWPLWPCLVLLAVFIPLSIWHQRQWNRTVAEYAALRRDAGATDDPWPTSDVRWVLSLQPWLLLFAAALLAIMVGFGIATLAAWPHRVLPWMNILNYYDRPYLASMLVAGTAAVVGVVALSIDLARSPWRRVASQVRRAVHAPHDVRERRFSAALKVDPGVPAS